MKSWIAQPLLRRTADSLTLHARRWLTTAIVGASSLLLPASVHAQGTVTTSDGLTLSLSSSGSVSALKLGSTNYAGSLASGFFFREAVPSSPSLATNGSFESGSGTPTSWTISGGTGGTWSIDSGNAVAGSRSMKVNIPGSTGLHSPNLFTTANFPLLPNTPYKLSCSMKTSGLSSALSLYLVQQDSSGAWTQTGVGSLTGTTGWRTYAMSITTSPNVVQGYLKAYISGGYGTAWLDDVQLIDVFGGNVPVAFGGTVTSSGGVLTQTASKNNLNLSAKFTSVGSAIKVDATLTDTTGADRGIQLAFRLPLDIVGWTWDNDFVTPMTIASETRYENLDALFARQTVGHTHSVYPFATVRNSAAAFSLAVPMGPLMDRFSYDDSDGFRVIYDLGVSPATTQSPSKATVSFWIYTQNPKWGLRSAAEKYYALNPANFTSPVTTLGAWAYPNIVDLSLVPDSQDFGWAYHERDKELAFDNANGILGLHYVSPTSWTRPFPEYAGQPQPSYSTLVTALNNDVSDHTNLTVDLTPYSEMATSVINTAPYDENGHYFLDYNTFFWNIGGWQMYPMLPDPDIAGSRYGIAKQYSVDARIAVAEADGNTLGGIFVDNMSATFGNLENYRKSLWAYLNSPLSFSYETRKVVAYDGDSMVKFCAAMRSYLHSQGLVMMGSVNPSSYSWFAHNLDIVGGECPGAELPANAYARRTLSYGLPWSNLFVGHVAQSATDVLAYLRQALLLGYFPGMNGYYWDDPSAYERDRGLFQQYIPLIRKVVQAGWKPVNYATSSNPSTFIERFGNPSAGTFYVTAQNSDDSANSVTITLDGAGLGISASTPVTVRELLSNTTRSVTRSGTNITFSETLDPGETSLYLVTPAVAGIPVPDFTFSPSNPNGGQSVQFTDLTTNGPTSWSWDFGDPASGSANTSTAKNPTHAFATGGTHTVKLTASNANGGATGQHTVTVIGVPDVDFTYSPSNPNLGQSVQFTDLSTGSPTSWSWNFGDPASGSANTSTLKNPTHKFVAGGTHTVKLTASNTYGSSTGLHTVTVIGIPHVDFTYSPSSPNVGQSVQFTDLSTGSPTSWSWNFGDPASGSANTSTLKNPTHKFVAGGTHTVKLTASNAYGSSTGQHTVTVIGVPNVDFTYSPSSPNVGQSVQFTDLSTGSPTSWSWNFGDPASGSANTSTLKNPTHKFIAGGTHTVKLTASNAYGSSTGQHTVTAE